MTEICEAMECPASPLFWPAHRAPRYLVDPVAFFVALIGAPLVVAVLGFWALGIPVYAVPLGGLPYLIIGGPILAQKLRHYAPETRRFAIIGLIANNVMFFAIALLLILMHAQTAIGVAALIFAFGLIFAPLWSAVFAILYRNLRREFYQNPIS